MKAILICPAERPAVAALSEAGPLASLPALGKPLIAYWIEQLAALEIVKDIRILAADRPELVRAALGSGSRWGLRIEVVPEQRELTPAEAREKYHVNPSDGWVAAPHDINVVEHFPGLPEQPLFTSYADWIAAVRDWIPLTDKTNRVGVREIQPGVFAGLRTRIAPDAKLIAPCWLGDYVFIGPHSIIGPSAVLENRVVVESASEISNSQVGPETFVGALTEVKDSFASGNLLVNWRNNSRTTVPDDFIMCSLGKRRQYPKASGIFGRVLAAFLMLVTLPVAALVVLFAKLRNRESIQEFIAVRPQLSSTAPPTETFRYYQLATVKGFFRCWPQLWNIIWGDFAWVGNSPLSPAEVAQLSNDFERLWLAAPIGLISLADAEGVTGHFTDEARACASFYAVQANWKLDLSILRRALL